MFQDRIQQRTLEQISDTPVPQVVEELVEVLTFFSQDRDQQRFAEQIFATPAISPTEVFTHFSQYRVQQRLHPQIELDAMSRCQVARSLSHLQQQDCVRWCHHLFLVLPVGVLIVLRLPVSCQQLESDL